MMAAGWLQRLLGGSGSSDGDGDDAVTGEDRFPLPETHDLAAEHRVISDLIAQEFARTQYQWAIRSLKDTSAGQEIAAADPPRMRRFLFAIAERRRSLLQRRRNGALNGESMGTVDRILEQILTEVFKRKMDFQPGDALALLRWADHPTERSFHPVLVAICERYLKQHGLDDELRSRLPRLRSLVKDTHPPARAAELAARVSTMLGETESATISLDEGEAWASNAMLWLSQQSDKRRVQWVGLLARCQSTTGSSPTQKWLKAASAEIDAITWPEFRQALLRWFPLVDEPRTTPFDSPHAYYRDLYNQRLVERSVDLLKGLVWCCALRDDRELARALMSLAVSAYRKVPGVGPRMVSLGNACVWALGEMPGGEGVGQLAMLKVKVKFGTAQKLIEKALATTAERLGVPRDEIEEMGVPAYGMEEVGIRREKLGDVMAEVAVVEGGGVELRWFKADGKRMKSVPASVKADHAEDLKELKAAAKDIERMLPAQRDRIDNLFLAQKSWPMQTWRERYLDHPLVGTLARRLIWTFIDGDTRLDGAWRDAGVVGPDDQVLQLTDGAQVELWHPIGRPVDEVLAWRGWLERHEVKQPFKQAHREVYVLTDAERNTRVYSNRYAAHLLKQHQFNALCAARGWRNKLRLMVDDTYPPASRTLENWGLRAEFWIEGAGEEFGTDTNETGTFLYVATDQVRFYPTGAAQLHAHAGGGGYEWSPYRAPGAAEPQPIPLDEVPPLVFSEVMRDVDLFVGVASVGNDANWLDQAARPERRDYWHSYSFGDLSGTALMRKAVLERVIPRLKIAPRCSFDDKFLRVRGDLREYKIHLGSGNILMAPNDQYLCIVPKPAAVDAAGGKVFLPFEGDRTLSIILSKAFLLVEDQKISDPTITRQIAR